MRRSETGGKLLICDYHQDIKEELSLYYKDLNLNNWRLPANDLHIYLKPIILKNIGFENLNFRFDFRGGLVDVY